jgi:hypothetical protein
MRIKTKSKNFSDEPTILATIEEEDVGVAATEAFYPYYPINGWAGEIRQRHVGTTVKVTKSLFSQLNGHRE